MKTQPIYISVDPQGYKKNKVSMLNSQIDLLNTIKRLENIRAIKNEKFKLKMKFYSLFSSLQDNIEKIEQKMPEVELPKEKKVREIKVVQEKPSPEKIAKKSTIDSELLEIQEKLKKLNSG